MRSLPHLLLAVLLLALNGCVPQPVQPAPASENAAAAAAASPDSNIHDGCVDSFDPAVDYFPHKLSVAYATGFDVEYHNHYKIVTVTNPWQGAQESFRYILLQCGAPAPTGVEGALIEVPSKTLSPCPPPISPPSRTWD